MDDQAVEATWQKMPDKAMQGTTVAQLEQMIAEGYQQQLEVERHETARSEASKILENTKKRILSVFQEFNKTSYNSSRGTVIRIKHFSVTMPQDPKGRTSFFDFLKSKDVFDSLITVHSKTLNSFYKREMDAAIEGGATKFAIPGIGEPKYSESLSLRRK